MCAFGEGDIDGGDCGDVEYEGARAEQPRAGHARGEPVKGAVAGGPIDLTIEVAGGAQLANAWKSAGADGQLKGPSVGLNLVLGRRIGLPPLPAWAKSGPDNRGRPSRWTVLRASLRNKNPAHRAISLPLPRVVSPWRGRLSRLRRGPPAAVERRTAAAAPPPPSLSFFPLPLSLRASSRSRDLAAEEGRRHRGSPRRRARPPEGERAAVERSCGGAIAPARGGRTVRRGRPQTKI
uniref:Uncharacterized protein n=1 Tax=Setaria viridis TaxID=4556 RepID=A0A4U6T471_SETVI|nr:hypothetical protein SEVIR_9G369100v2 [Setaria viridis]